MFNVSLPLTLNDAIGRIQAQFSSLAQVIDTFRLLLVGQIRQSSVVIRLCQIRVQTDSLGIVLNGVRIVVPFHIHITSVVIQVSALVQLDSGRQV